MFEVSGSFDGIEAAIEDRRDLSGTVEGVHGTLEVSFPYSLVEEDGVLPESPVDWCADAGVSVQDGPLSHYVEVWISFAGETGALVMRAERLEDGTVIVHLPHPSKHSYQGRVVELHPGTLAIEATMPDGEGGAAA